jgi:hypothetical protein
MKERGYIRIPAYLLTGKFKIFPYRSVKRTKKRRKKCLSEGFKFLEDQGRSLPVPEGGIPGGNRCRHPYCPDDLLRVCSREAIPVIMQGFNPFCFIAEGDAGLSEEIGFFLQASRIGQDLYGMQGQ